MNKTILMLMLCAAGALCAAEIHVAKSGNDKNPGSADAPFATIKKASRVVKPGDVVKIGPGIFREQIYFKCNGTEDAPIVFAGTRGKDGEYLTIVESPGRTLSEWTPAPELGTNVWKTPIARRPDLIMMDGYMIAYVNRYTMELKPWAELPKELDQNMFWGAFGPNCKRLPGFDLLKLPPDIWVTHSYFGKRKEQFWPTIGNVLTGWHDGNLYLRFANDDKPEEHSFTATYEDGFIVQNVSNLIYRNLHMRASRKQFNIQGTSSHITIEKCLLMHGGVRIHIDPTVTDTVIRDNVLTSGFIRSDLFGHRSHREMRSCLLYLIFKYIIGQSSSDDLGVRDFGKNTKIIDNIIMQGLIGMDAFGPGVEVSGNVIRQMSSVGITTGEATIGVFHHNLVMDCGIPLRIHRLRHKRVKREEYHYSNLYVQPRDVGSQMFVHCESWKEDDKVNFEPGTQKYLENPPNPVDAGKIYIYHNTFWGGNEDGVPMFNVRGLWERFRMQMPFFLINNIIKDNPRFSIVTHELAGPNLLYVFEKDIPLESRREKDVVKLNKVVDSKCAKLIWNKNDLPGLPDMTLAPDSPALEAGIDISKPFTVNGKQYPAFVGFKPGYFKGKAPAAGALQFGENQDYFIAKHQHAEAILKMLKELSEKTAAEARRRAKEK